MCLTDFFPGQVLSEKAKQRSNLNLSQQGIVRIADIINSSHIRKGEEDTIRVIDLDNNNITEFDLEILINVFPNLKAIALRKNQINDINPATTQNNKLLKVDLCENRLELKENVFFQFSLLTHLYLCENGIRQMPEKVFNGLEQLKFLDLSNNKIFSLQVSSFSQLRNLETLDLSYNAIETWVPDDFLWQEKLNVLNIKGNQLKSLPPLPVREGWSANLQGNKIYCGCHLPSHKQTPVLNSTILVECSDQKEIWLGYHGTLLHFIQQHTPTCEKPSVEFVSRRINGEFLMTCTGSGVPVPHQIEINTTSGSIIKNLSTKIKPILTLSESQEKSAKCTVRSLIGVESAATRLKESFRPAADIGTTTTGEIIGLSIFTLLSITVNIAVASVAFWAVTVERPVIEERETLAL